MVQEGMLEQMETFAVRARAIAPLCDNEEQTKVSLINPYLELLGYDVRDPRHVRLEVRADIHEGREKVDYAVMREGNPWMVVEAKAASTKLGSDSRPTKQIVRYAMATDVKFAVLTNGRVWRWFRKADGSGMLEDAPFLEHDVCEPGQREFRWLAGIHQARFDGEAVERIADEESLQSRFEGWFEQAKEDPPERFLGVLLNDMGIRATAAMLARARAAWTATVRSREAAILARATRRLQGNEEPEREQAQETKQEAKPRPTQSAKRRQHYRFRIGEANSWEYAGNARSACIAVAAKAAEAIGIEALGALWTKSVVSEVAEGDERYYDAIPGTDFWLYGNFNTSNHTKRLEQAVEAVEGLAVETESGERDDNEPRDQWPWRPVGSTARPAG